MINARPSTIGSAVKEVTKSEQSDEKERNISNSSVSEEAVNKRETAETADNFTLF